jgi:hypothetical protein
VSGRRRMKWTMAKAWRMNPHQWKRSPMESEI